MRDIDKSREQLINELVEMRQRVVELEALETERKRAEEALRESGEKESKSAEEWEELFDASSDIIALISPDFEILRINKVGYESIDKKREEVIGEKCYEVVHNLDGPIDGCPCKDLIRTKKAGVGEVTQWGRYYIATASPILDKNNELIAFAHTVKDITERKRAEQKIQQQSEFLNNVLNSLGHPFYVVDVNDYTIKMANPAAKLGKLSEKSTCYALTHRRDKPCRDVEHVCPLQEVKKTRKPVVVEHIHYDEDGNAKNVEVHGYPIFDSEGNVIQMIECNFDITERKRTEEALKESEERYRALVSLKGKVGEAITMLQDTEQGDGIQTFVNDEWPRITGYSRKELLGMLGSRSMPSLYHLAFLRLVSFFV